MFSNCMAVFYMLLLFQNSKPGFSLKMPIKIWIFGIIIEIESVGEKRSIGQTFIFESLHGLHTKRNNDLIADCIVC